MMPCVSSPGVATTYAIEGPFTDPEHLKLTHFFTVLRTNANRQINTRRHQRAKLPEIRNLFMCHYILNE